MENDNGKGSVREGRERQARLKCWKKKVGEEVSHIKVVMRGKGEG